MTIEAPSFEKCTNFGDQKATLPIENHKAFSNPERPIHQGAFTSVIEIGEVKFFDTYPINKIQEFTRDNEFVPKVTKVLREGTYEDLIALAGEQDTKEGVGRRQIIQYLSLLKYLGADF
ncbi:MAG: hypothetical protein AAB443_00665 [Patescibacteria group bacterium]